MQPVKVCYGRIYVPAYLFSIDWSSQSKIILMAYRSYTSSNGICLVSIFRHIEYTDFSLALASYFQSHRVKPFPDRLGEIVVDGAAPFLALGNLLRYAFVCGRMLIFEA